MNIDNPTHMQQIFQDFVTAGGRPLVTAFRAHLESLIQKEITGPGLTQRSRKLAPGAHDWRDALEARFAGRGNKWQYVSLEEIAPTLDRFDEEGIDTTDYRAWTSHQGKAWIRYLKPRIVNGQNVAAFTVHTLGSKIWQTHQLHFIPVDRLDDTITLMEGTPFQLKLEDISADNVIDEDPIVEDNEVDEDDLIG